MILTDSTGLPQAKIHNIFNPLGLGDAVRDRLRELSGHEPLLSYNCNRDPQSTWLDSAHLESLRSILPKFITTTWRAPDPAQAGKWLHLADGLWIDIDYKPDLDRAVKALNQTVEHLQRLDIPIGCCSLFASGGKGFHVFVPLALIVPVEVDKWDIATARYFTLLCREFVYQIATEYTDMGIYSGGRGRLIRQAGARRTNGAYKVPLAWSEGLTLNADKYTEICSERRAPIQPDPVNGYAEGAAKVWVKAYKEFTRKKPVAMRKTSGTKLDAQGYPAGAERKRIVDALTACIPLDSYDDWLRIGMALKSTGARDALDLWIAFSKAQGRKFKPGLCESKWEGFGTGVGIATLFYLAKNGGQK